jgi:hypothetical protein
MLDPDHGRAMIGEHHPRERRRADADQLDDAYAFENASHRLSIEAGAARGHPRKSLYTAREAPGLSLDKWLILHYIKWLERGASSIGEHLGTVRRVRPRASRVSAAETSIGQL